MPPNAPHSPTPFSSAEDKAAAEAAVRGLPPAPYICPMCEGVRADGPGACPQCGMPLEKNPLAQRNEPEC
ncbi:MAG TPA: heavy metal-binding domain-containing protein, partial [Prosthecobacter sp.]